MCRNRAGYMGRNRVYCTVEGFDKISGSFNEGLDISYSPGIK